MIRLVSDLPDISGFDAGYLKIKCLYDSFRFDNSVLFWRQQGGAYRSLSGGNMTISGGAVCTEEHFEFLSLISPSSVFCPEDTAIKLKNNYTAANVMRRLGEAAKRRGTGFQAMNCISFLIYPIFRCRLIPNLLWIGAGGLTAAVQSITG